MNADLKDRKLISVAVVDCAPLLLVGYRAILTADTGFDLHAISFNDLHFSHSFDVALIGVSRGKNIVDILDPLRFSRPKLRVIVIGCTGDDQLMLAALSHGAKGFVDEKVSENDLQRAIRDVHSGAIWAPRRVLSAFVERAGAPLGRDGPLAGPEIITTRERQVLEMLIAGRSNKEIAVPLGIRERTVKCHVSKLMRKVGVHNRIMLSMRAVSNPLVFTQ